MASTVRIRIKATPAFYLNPFWLSWGGRVEAFRDSLEGSGWIISGAPVLSTTGFQATMYAANAAGSGITLAGADALRRAWDNTPGVDVLEVVPVAGPASPETDRRDMAGGTIIGGVTDRLDSIGRGTVQVAVSVAVVAVIAYAVTRK
jgi:hypothetical protein